MMFTTTCTFHVLAACQYAVVCLQEDFADGWLQERAALEQRIAKLQRENEQLLAGKVRMEQQLRTEVEHLKLQVRPRIITIAQGQ